MGRYYFGGGGGGGGGGGISAEQLITVARGFSLANFLKSANGTCPGTTTCTIGGIILVGEAQSADDDVQGKCLVSGGTEFNSGYALGFDSARPYAQMADVGGSKLSTGSFHPSWGWTSGADASGWQFANLKAIVMALVRNGAVLSLWLNGLKWRSISLSDPGGITPSATGLFVGNNVGASSPADDCGIAGAAYAETAFTDSEILSWTRACMHDLDVVDGGAGFDSLWSFKAMGLGDGDACPATIDDQVGAVDLVRNGALTISHERASWL